LTKLKQSGINISGDFKVKNIISVYKPSIKRKDLEYVLNSMVMDQIDYGEFAKNFERRLTERVGCYSTLAVNSYYSAIEVVLEALEIGEGDEVILPSFIPQVYLNAIMRRKAVPVLVDLQKDSFEPSIEHIRESTTPKTKLIFLYYYFGYTYDPAPYLELAQHVVEDISSVIGAKAGEFKVGTTSRYAIADFSTKGLITTGEGGAVFSSGRKTHSRITSIIEKDYEVLENFQPRLACLIPDLNAAMGVSQDESLNHRLKIRETIGKIYEEAVKKGRSTIILPQENCEKFYTDFPIIVKSNLKDVIAFLRKNDVEAIRPFPYPLHHYLNLPKEKFPNTEFFYLNTLLLPIHSTLVKKEVDLIAKVTASMF
jgi:perosamine synthetase